ncbi:hypothetical protein CDE51_12260, partial [Pasteurella multocida]
KLPRCTWWVHVKILLKMLARPMLLHKKVDLKFAIRHVRQTAALYVVGPCKNFIKNVGSPNVVAQKG